VNVAPKKVTNLGIVELDEITTIRGSIVDPNGLTRGGKFGLHGADSRSIDWVLYAGRMNVIVNKNGTFECKDLARGTYIITLDDPPLGFLKRVPRQSWLVDVTNNYVTNLKLEVRPGYTVRIVYDFDEITQYVAILKDSNGAVLYDRGIAHEGAIVLDLPSGTYQLFLYTDFDNFKKIDFTVKSEPVTIRIDK